MRCKKSTAASKATTWPEAGDDTPQFPTLNDLAPLIEAVHHACRAGEYDEANDIRRNQIYQDARKVLIHQLGANETSLNLMLEFFPNGDPTQEPQVSNPAAKSFILNETGVCLMSLGRLAEAVPFYERANKIKLEITKDWHNASIGYRNLAGLHTYLGNLAAGADAAREALALARRAENKHDKWVSLTWKARIAHLSGEIETANEAFEQAKVLDQEIVNRARHPNRNPGIWYADHLRRRGDISTARQVTNENLRNCEYNHWDFLVSQCHRVLGDLDADENQRSNARNHYDEALRIARGISKLDVLIEALLTRGRWAAKQGEAKPALNDLDETLGYAVDSGYRIYEADIRNALAWAHLVAGHPDSARAEAVRARRMSEVMGYYWGKVDADEVLGVIAGA